MFNSNVDSLIISSVIVVLKELKLRSELVVETSSNRTLRTCKRGVVAIRRNSTVSSANSNLFYIAFGGLPCVDDKNIVYGEIIDGYV